MSEYMPAESAHLGNIYPLGGGVTCQRDDGDPAVVRLKEELAELETEQALVFQSEVRLIYEARRLRIARLKRMIEAGEKG